MASFEELGIKTKASGGRYSTTCPKCAPERKAEHRNAQCLTVNDEPPNQWWKCNHCGFSGNLKVYGQYDRVRLAAKMPVSKPTLYSKEVSEFLASKQITPETALKRGCYEIEKFKKKILCFPYYYHRTLVNVMFRAMEEGEKKVWQIGKDAGTKTCFWGLEHLDLAAKNEIIITEGQTDLMTIDQCGYMNVLSVPMGAPNAGDKQVDKKLEFITDPYIVELFKNVDKFYLAVDNDANGICLRDHLASLIGKDKCYIFNYPAGYKDPNEVYAGNTKNNLDPKGKAGIENLFITARPYPIGGILSVSDVRAELDLLRHKGYERGLICGHSQIDRFISVQKKRLMVITGISGNGKSTFARWYDVELCKNNPELKFVLYTPESRPVHREYAKMAEIISGARFKSGQRNSMSDEQFESALQFVEKHFIIIDPTEKNFEAFNKKDNKNPKNLDSIMNYILYLKKTQNVSGFLIDAWNKIDHTRPTGIQETDFISRELDRMLVFLEMNDLFGQIIAHPTKMERKIGGNYKRPGLYDIKGSSAWYEKADIGIVIHRDKYRKTSGKDENDEIIWEIDNTAPNLFICEKMKFDELGEEGEIKMWMDRNNGDRFIFDNPHAKKLKSKEAQKAMDLPDNIKDAIGDTDDLPF